MKKELVAARMDTTGSSADSRTASEDWGVPSAASDAVIAACHPSPENGGPCATCAFRHGTEANQSSHTMILARLCVEGMRPFQCHEQPQLCRGFIAAANLRGTPTGMDDERWAEVAGLAAEMYADAIAAGKAADRAAEARAKV